MDNAIVLFDGVCNYCNAMVNFAIKFNKSKSLRFAALQSKTGQLLRKQYNVLPEIDSVVFIENKKAYVYSTAALKICKHLIFPFNLLVVLLWVPKFIREPIYKWIAKNRYKWFGKKEQCMVPTPELKNRFLV